MIATSQIQDVPRRRVPPVLVRLAEVSQVLLPGIYAWFVTVIPTATASRSATYLWVPALLALACLVAGGVMTRRHSRLGYALGIWGFLIACLATWLLGRSALQIERLDPWRAGAGSIGWALFALGWGTPWRIGHHPEDDPRAQLHPKLEPRCPPRLRPALSVTIGIVGALSCMLLAWRETEHGRGLLIHGAGLACAVAVIHSSATIGVAQGMTRHPFQPRQRVAYAFPWIMAASALAVIGIAWALGN